MFFEYKIDQSDEKIKRFFDFNAELLLNTIEEETLNVLALSLILSQNDDIKSCLKYENRQTCKKNLKFYISILQNVPLYKDILIHLHSNDLKSVIRSWDDEKKGDDLRYFRHTIYETKQNKTPTSGIEIGKCGVFIRGVSPVFANNNFLGSIEIMLGFNHLYNLSKRQKYNLLILIKDNYKIECFKNSHIKIHGFNVIDKNDINLNILPFLDKIDFKNQNFIKLKNDYFYSKKLYDFKNNHIGYIIMHKNSKSKINDIF